MDVSHEEKYAEEDSNAWSCHVVYLKANSRGKVQAFALEMKGWPIWWVAKARCGACLQSCGAESLLK